MRDEIKLIFEELKEKENIDRFNITDLITEKRVLQVYTLMNFDKSIYTNTDEDDNELLSKIKEKYKENKSKLETDNTLLDEFKRQIKEYITLLETKKDTEKTDL